MSDGKELLCENAFQRFSRLLTRPSLLTLEKNLFPSGPQPGEIIEIYGDSSIGKTLLLLEFVKKCILPKSYMGLLVGGLDAGAIFLNTDLHFNIMTLVKLLRNYLNHSIPKELPDRNVVINEIVETSLKKVTVLNVFDSETMYTTFYLLQRLLSVNKDISLLIIDSISAYYWQDRFGDGIKKMDSYVVNVLKSLHQCIHPFKISVVFSRPAYFQTKNSAACDCSSVYDLRKINTSIHLKPWVRESGSSHMAEVRTSSAFFMKFYTISEHGISWSL